MYEVSQDVRYERFEDRFAAFERCVALWSSVSLVDTVVPKWGKWTGMVDVRFSDGSRHLFRFV